MNKDIDGNSSENCDENCDENSSENIRIPDSVFTDKLINNFEENDFFDNERNPNLDEEMRLALSVSQKEYFDNQNNHYFDYFDYIENEINLACEISLNEQNEIIKNKMIEIEENRKMELEEKYTIELKNKIRTMRVNTRINSLQHFCKKIERLNFSEKDIKIKKYIQFFLAKYFNLEIDFILVDEHMYKDIFEIIDTYYLIPTKKNYGRTIIPKEEDEIIRSIFSLV